MKQPPYNKDCVNCAEFPSCKGVWQEECTGPHSLKPEESKDD